MDSVERTDPLAALVAEMRTWRDEDTPPPDTVVGTLVLLTGGGVRAARIPLDTDAVRRLRWDLADGTAGRRAQAATADRVRELADNLTAAHRDRSDPGELLAAALQGAASRVPMGCHGLTPRNAQTWRCEVVRRMAATGPHPDSALRVAALTAVRDLWEATARAGDDTGEVLARAVTTAAEMVGSIGALADGTRWERDLTALAAPHVD